MAEQPQESLDKNVEIWRIKKLIKSLEAARGNGTSMISLIIPPRDQISRIATLLVDEYGTAANIRSRVNRLSVLSAITSVQGRLKLYNKVPNNGLVIYCGTIPTDDGKEKKVNIDFEPFKPINTSLYLCDNKFHTEALQALLADDSRFGFIVMDGNGALFGILQGNSREVITKFSVDLPKKHGRGGQSALRFARLRMEKRHNYVRKVAETAVQCFITDDKVNVSGLILAGLADFKTELHQSDMFDQRLQVKPQESSDKNVEIWRIKKLIKSLEAARGNGTSMVSLIIPPRDQISRIATLLVDEYGTAANIRSRVNRLSVLSAITSVQGRLKLYNKVPNNGLVIYCGTILTDDGKEKKVNIDFEPFKPINTSLYLCDNKFHTEALQALLADDSRFGFIVMDGNGALFGILQVAETAVQCFITDDKVNVSGLILAGLADFKTELHQSDMFDQRLQVKVLKRVDVSYGGEDGFNQAIELAAETLGDVKFIQEKKLISRYFDEVSKDSGQYCFGIDETLKALEMGAVETLIVWENFDVMRYVLRNPQTQEKRVLYLRADQEKEKSHFQDKESGVELEHDEEMPLLEWYVNNYKNFGATLEIVTDKSQEGSQFVRGFGGVGGILRYKVDLQNLNVDEDAEAIDYSDYD
ncbi:unnamed protein product [Adineta steineri]|uniref:Eukaryotic peptide chain release factor subunit 1 n=3 Tax=Adineta steineri TaxID=433720 RepID=A0A815FNB1_9BILA|nr:unnamed protein product [Adineta steineri]